MLNKYVKINGERVPNPIDYSEGFSKVSNEFQSEAGDDLAIDVRAGKYSGSLKFQVSSRWKNKLLVYAKMQSVKYTGITRGDPRPSPRPNSPPEAMAISACTIW